MITRVFWTLFTFEALASLLLLIAIFTKKFGPEGPVGAIVVIFPLIVLMVVAAIVIAKNSDSAKLGGIIVLSLPLVPLVLGPFYTRFVSYQVERSMLGDDSFRQPAQRNLAHAIKEQNLVKLQSLIPLAGDLNKQYEGETLLRFAINNTPAQSSSIDIVKALLDAGANPNIEAFSKSFPLVSAFYYGPLLTELLLNAGADPNLVGDANRPLWWDALSNATEDGLRILRLVLDHGADVKKRDAEGGPVAWAAYHKNWRAVWLLIERGAEWQNEQAFGQSIRAMLAHDFEYREGAKLDIPEEMLNLKAKLLGGTPEPSH